FSRALGRMRGAIARPVVVPAAAGLLPEAAGLAQAIGNLRVTHVRVFPIAALADRPADVVAGQIAHAQRSHRETELLDRAVDLRGQRALFEHEKRLAEVLLDHSVADEAVAHARHDR